MTAQPLSSLRLCSSEPLTDCSFAHPQRCRDVFLLPPLLPQLPGSQAPTFFPILWFVFFLHSSILSGLATHATVYRTTASRSLPSLSHRRSSLVKHLSVGYQLNDMQIK